MKMVHFLLDGSQFRLIAIFPSKVSLCFSRDPYVCLQLCSKFGSRAQTTARFAPALDITSSNSGTARAEGDAIGGQSAVTSAFPPSSCIPFYGWAMYGTFGYNVRKEQTMIVAFISSADVDVMKEKNKLEQIFCSVRMGEK
jgi:hypothetical protein